MLDGLEQFGALDDSARVRVVPLGTALSGERTAPLLGVLRELLQQWHTSGLIDAGAAAVIAEGRFLLIAYEPSHGDVSGCTKDSLTHVLLNFEAQLGVPLVNTPRVMIELDGEFQLMSPREFKSLRVAGRVSGSTRVYDHLVQTLGDVRAGRFQTTCDSSWYARI
ncbi:hypothetical protein HZA57_05935 [Candidatus Poribacteria bacterium]|nr:hypothetical protein [Candidatus Poribacteria bacterium]